MTYTEYLNSELIIALRNSLNPIIGELATRCFLSKVYDTMNERKIDINKKMNQLTFRAKSGLIADFLPWAIGTDEMHGVDNWYWWTMNQIVETHLSNKVLSK